MFGSRYRNVASCVFFCKQKTAYEMRISDWSSDVCSSDLRSVDPGPCIAGEAHKAEADGPGIGEQGRDRGDDAFPVAQPHPPLGNAAAPPHAVPAVERNSGQPPRLLADGGVERGRKMLARGDDASRARRQPDDDSPD